MLIQTNQFTNNTSIISSLVWDALIGLKQHNFGFVAY